MRFVDAVVTAVLFGRFSNRWCAMQLRAFVFFGWAALASLDCCSFSFFGFGFCGLQLYVSGSDSNCNAVARTLNAIPGLSGVDCTVRTLSVVLLLLTLWPLLFDAVQPVVGGGLVLAAFC